MILSYHELCRLAIEGVIQPVSKQAINGTSIDVSLGAELLYERRHYLMGSCNTLTLGRRDKPMSLEHHDLLRQGQFIMHPGQFVLAHTVEIFDLPLDITAEFRLKSSVARMGLSHALAVWCDPGWNGSSLTMELHNISQFHRIELLYGEKIGQMIFHRHEPVPLEHSYRARGAYNRDTKPSPTKPAINEE